MPIPTLAARLPVLLLALAALAGPAAGQQDGLRMGVSIGGVCLIGLDFEYVQDGRSAELTVGTWSFRDLSLSLVGKQYLGRSAMKPVVGAGIWVAASRPADGERTGVALLARAPIGFDWRMTGEHTLGFALNLNKALAVHRSDSTAMPMTQRLVPLPGFTYFWEP